MLKSNWRSIQSRRRSIALLYGGLERVFEFDPALATFTPYMDKRATSVFATSPLVQGKWDGTGASDSITYSVGSQISSYFYETADNYQGSISFWITPEWDGNDGKWHFICGAGATNEVLVQKSATNYLMISLYGGSLSGEVAVDISAWTAGTKYHVVARWNKTRPIDGTNYMCLSINDSHTFGRTTPITTNVPISIRRVGQLAANYFANAIIEGLTVYRRVLFDGTYGVDVGNGDEINLIYAAGAGKDPCLVTGSWDVVFCLPTDSTPGALVTG